MKFLQYGLTVWVLRPTLLRWIFFPLILKSWPSIFIDTYRVDLFCNVLISISQSFTRQSKFTYGLVVEEITTRDETSNVCTNGSRALPSGGITMDGPPTTLSGTGTDRMAFVQANITRDNTKFVNGAIVGERTVFQV